MFISASRRFYRLVRHQASGRTNLRRIGTLVISDSLITGNTSSTLSAISAAQNLKIPVTLLVCGSETETEQKVKMYSRVTGISRILVAKGQAYESCFPEEIDKLAVKIINENKLVNVVLPHSSYGRELAPRIAALLGINQISDVIQLSETECVRGIFAGNALTKIDIKDNKLVITIRQSNFEPAQNLPEDSPAVKVETLAYEAKTSKFKKLISDTKSLTNKSMPDLASAKFVVCGGRSFETKDKFELVYRLASKLNGAVASTRAAVDSDLAPSDTQVGQTGKTVAPLLYIALGVSGAIQHISGMSNSKVIIAVNNDPEAPIFSSSDYGLVKDMFEVIPELMQKLPNYEKGIRA